MFSVAKKQWRDDLWTWEECQIIRREYRANPTNYDELAKLLPGRTPRAVKTMAGKLGVVPKRPSRGRDAVTPFNVPAYLLNDRDRRANEPRTLCQALMGDPPFSQSALCRAPQLGGGQSKAEKAYEAGPTYLDPATAD